MDQESLRYRNDEQNTRDDQGRDAGAPSAASPIYAGRFLRNTPAQPPAPSGEQGQPGPRSIPVLSGGPATQTPLTPSAPGMPGSNGTSGASAMRGDTAPLPALGSAPAASSPGMAAIPPSARSASGGPPSERVETTTEVRIERVPTSQPGASAYRGASSYPGYASPFAPEHADAAHTEAYADEDDGAFPHDAGQQWEPHHDDEESRMVLHPPAAQSWPLAGPTAGAMAGQAAYGDQGDHDDVDEDESPLGRAAVLPPAQTLHGSTDSLPLPPPGRLPGSPAAAARPASAKAGQANAPWVAARSWGTTNITYSANTAAGMSYVLGWLSGTFFFFGEHRNRYVRFHALQAVMLTGAWTVLAVALFLLTEWVLLTQPPTTILFTVVGAVFVALFMVFGWFYAMVAAWNGHYLRLPIIGRLADRLSAPPANPFDHEQDD